MSTVILPIDDTLVYHIGNIYLKKGTPTIGIKDNFYYLLGHSDRTGYGHNNPVSIHLYYDTNIVSSKPKWEPISSDICVPHKVPSTLVRFPNGYHHWKRILDNGELMSMVLCTANKQTTKIGELSMERVTTMQVFKYGHYNKEYMLHQVSITMHPNDIHKLDYFPTKYLSINI